MPKSKQVIDESEEIEGLTIMDSKIEDKVDNVQKDVSSLLDATKELTKTVGELVAAWEKWRKAGKFILVLGLTFLLGGGQCLV